MVFVVEQNRRIFLRTVILYDSFFLRLDQYLKNVKIAIFLIKSHLDLMEPESVVLFSKGSLLDD